MEILIDMEVVSLTKAYPSSRGVRMNFGFVGGIHQRATVDLGKTKPFRVPPRSEPLGDFGICSFYRSPQRTPASTTNERTLYENDHRSILK
jgi:hypothetical protein